MTPNPHAVTGLWISVNLDKEPERKIGTHGLAMRDCVLALFHGEEKVSVHCPPTIHGGLSPGLISHWDKSSSKYYRFCLFSNIKVHRCKHLLESVRISDTLPLKGEPKYSTRIIREKKNSNAWKACLCVFARVLQMLQGGGQREHGLLSICRDLPHGIVAGDMQTELSYFILF